MNKFQNLENFYLWVIRKNQETPIQGVHKEWKFNRWKIQYSCRLKSNLWGRFGGGWNWKLGFMAGGSTLVISLLVAEITISRLKP